MIYNSLIYLLVVILILSTSSVPAVPQIQPFFALLILIGKGFAYHQVVYLSFIRRGIATSRQYFAAEQRFSILAIASFAFDVYLLDCKYYLARLPFADIIPAIINIGTLSLFFIYLSILWYAAGKSYRITFHSTRKVRSIVTDNLKTTLSIILPWIFLILLSDLLQLTPFPALKKILASSWGEPAIILIFFLILAVVFPAIVTRLWNCRPMPQGEMRSFIERFCRSLNLGYADIMVWPLFEGHVLTAGVMGLSKRFRYLLITPALLKALNAEELEAVLAHEIGHIKRFHLPLYIFLFLGFGLLAQSITYPILYLLLNSDVFSKLLLLSEREAGTVIAFGGTIPLFIIMIVYFRYIFGFFMRNFERQADLYALEVTKRSAPLVSVLEKIGILSGNIRDMPSWHHFSIAQRVNFLEECDEKPAVAKNHHKKVYTTLFLYLLAMVFGILLMMKMPDDLLTDATREKLAETVITQKIQEEPQNAFWLHLMGDLQFEKKLYKEAIQYYEGALEINSRYTKSLNNLAWLLLTVEEKKLRDPSRALMLAKIAANQEPQGYILDTLATAYWMNGYKEMALITAKQAIEIDPANRSYYNEQFEKFLTEEP